MSEEREKGKHLTLEDRYEIQRGLREHRSFSEIAEVIGCSPDTISKEIRGHRYHKPRHAFWVSTRNRIDVNSETHAEDVMYAIKNEVTSAGYHAENVLGAMSCALTL